MNMVDQVAFAKLVEIVLIGITSFLLMQPQFVFRAASPRSRALMTWAGMLFLCVTFCWSVIFGAVLFINDMTLRI